MTAQPSLIHALISISRLSAMTGATPRALRHYEEVGLIRPRRSSCGVRLYTPEECERVSLVVRMRRCDVTLDDIRDLFERNASADDRQARVRSLLERKADDLVDKLAAVRAALAAEGDASLVQRDAA